MRDTDKGSCQRCRKGLIPGCPCQSKYQVMFPKREKWGDVSPPFVDPPPQPLPPQKKTEAQLTGAAGRGGKHTFTNSKLRSAFPQRTRGWAPAPQRLTVTVLFLDPGPRKGPMSLRKEKENIKGWEGLLFSTRQEMGKRGKGRREILPSARHG